MLLFFLALTIIGTAISLRHHRLTCIRAKESYDPIRARSPRGLLDRASSTGYTDEVR